MLAIVTLLWTCQPFSHFTFHISLEVLYYHYKSTFTWEMKWTYTGLRFQTGVKTSSVHIQFLFEWISKGLNSLMGMCRHFILGSVYMIFYHPKLNFISVKMSDMKSIPTLSFKRTCALNATSNKSALIQFVSGKLSHAGLKFHFGQNGGYEIDTVWSFISPQFMWAQVKSWLKTKVRISTEMKSHTGFSSFRFSCERTLTDHVEIC